MNNKTIIYAAVLLAGVFISAISQVMLKKASQKTYSSFIREYLNPLVMTAYILFFGTTFLSILAYRGIPLSMGPILEATSYIYVTFWGVTVFKERINRQKLIALAFIIVGIVIYALWG